MPLSSFSVELIDNENAFGKVVQIASGENMTWKEILKLYLDILNSKRGLKPKIYLSDKMKAIDELYEGGYNTIYDRVYNRHFNSELIGRLTNNLRGATYKDMRSGLSECLTDFLDNNRPFGKIDWQFEAYQDLLTSDYANDSEFENEDERSTYLHYRNMPLSEVGELDVELEEILF